jgi:(2Fe-2S) ferredoxin
MFFFLVAFGGGALGYFFDSSDQIVTQEYLATCHFCYSILANKEFVTKISGALACTEFLDRVESTLQARQQSLPKTDRHQEKKNRLVLCKGSNCFGKTGHRGVLNYFLNGLVDSGKYRVTQVTYCECLGHCDSGPNLLREDSGIVLHRTDRKSVDELLDKLTIF